MAAYLGIAGDFHPLYADAEHARAGPFGGPVVPGPMIAAVAVGLGNMDVPLARTVALVGMAWRFARPVRPGDSIRTRWRLNRKRDVEDPRNGLAAWQVEVENQRGEVVATGEVVRLVARREQPAEVAEPVRTGRRRRRRRGPASEAGQTAGAEVAPSEPTPAGPEVPTPRRRRRRRGGQPEQPAGPEVLALQAVGEA